MAAQVVCAISYGYTFVRNNTAPDELGAALVELIRRDGQDAVSDMLDSEEEWDYIDPDEVAVDGDPLVRPGYGRVCPKGLPEDWDLDFSYGLLTTGTIMITESSSRCFVAIHPFSDDALSEIEAFCDDLG